MNSAVSIATSGIATPTLTSADWKGIISRFLASSDIMQSSRDTYTWCIEKFFSWVADTNRNPSQLSYEDILCYKRHLESLSLSPKTCSLYLVVVRRFYAWAESTRQYPDIAKWVKSPKEKDKTHFVKMHLTHEQVSKLIGVCQEHPRDYAMIMLMLHTGLRVIEVTRANIGDIRNYLGRKVLLVWGKGMTFRPTEATTHSKVIITDRVMEAIDAYLATRDGRESSDPLFITDGYGHHGQRMTTRAVQKRISKYLDMIGCTGHEYSTHSLRHTAGVEILKRTNDNTKVQEVLRHASPNVSQIYTESIRDEQRMRLATESLIDYGI